MQQQNRRPSRARAWTIGGGDGDPITSTKRESRAGAVAGATGDSVARVIADPRPS